MSVDHTMKVDFIFIYNNFEAYVGVALNLVTQSLAYRTVIIHPAIKI